MSSAAAENTRTIASIGSNEYDPKNKQHLPVTVEHPSSIGFSFYGSDTQSSPYSNPNEASAQGEKTNTLYFRTDVNFQTPISNQFFLTPKGKPPIYPFECENFEKMTLEDLRGKTIRVVETNSYQNGISVYIKSSDTESTAPVLFTLQNFDHSSEEAPNSNERDIKIKNPSSLFDNSQNSNAQKGVSAKQPLLPESSRGDENPLNYETLKNNGDTEQVVSPPKRIFKEDDDDDVFDSSNNNDQNELDKAEKILQEFRRTRGLTPSESSEDFYPLLPEGSDINFFNAAMNRFNSIQNRDQNNSLLTTLDEE